MNLYDLLAQGDSEAQKIVDDEKLLCPGTPEYNEALKECCDRLLSKPSNSTLALRRHLERERRRVTTLRPEPPRRRYSWGIGPVDVPAHARDFRVTLQNGWGLVRILGVITNGAAVDNVVALTRLHASRTPNSTRVVPDADVWTLRTPLLVGPSPTKIDGLLRPVRGNEYVTAWLTNVHDAPVRCALTLIVEPRQ